jgi:hypothetical protein
MDMYDRGLATKFDIVDLECSRSSLCSSKEFDMERDRVGLVLLCERGAEVRSYDLEYASCYIAAIGNYTSDQFSLYLQ